MCIYSRIHHSRIHQDLRVICMEYEEIMLLELQICEQCSYSLNCLRLTNWRHT